MYTSSTICRKVGVSTLATASLYLAVITSLLGCQPVALGQDAATPTFSAPGVQKTILPPMTMTPTPECLPVPGVDLDVAPLSANAVRIKITGLNSNEHVTLVFYSEAPGQSVRIENGPIKVMSENGSLEYTQGNLVDLTPGSPEDWQIQVIHSRGVACTIISLP